MFISLYQKIVWVFYSLLTADPFFNMLQLLIHVEYLQNEVYTSSTYFFFLLSFKILCFRFDLLTQDTFLMNLSICNYAVLQLFQKYMKQYVSLKRNMP